MSTVLLYDVPRKEARTRLESLLRQHGFVWLFGNARWSRKPPTSHAAFVRRCRARLAGESYRILLLETSRRDRRQWLTNDPKGGQQ